MPPETPAPVDTGYEKARPVATATGPADPKAPKQKVKVELEQLDNGTFMVTCFKSDAGEPSKTAYPTLETAVEYVLTEFGGGEPAEEPAAPDAAAPPDGRYAQAEGAPAGSSQPYLG